MDFVIWAYPSSRNQAVSTYLNFHEKYMEYSLLTSQAVFSVSLREEGDFSGRDNGAPGAVPECGLMLSHIVGTV